MWAISLDPQLLTAFGKSWYMKRILVFLQVYSSLFLEEPVSEDISDMIKCIFFFWNFHCCKVVQSSSLMSTEWFVSQHCQPIINFSMVPPLDTKSSLASLHLFPFHEMGLHFWLLPTAVTQSAILRITDFQYLELSFLPLFDVLPIWA